MKILYLDLDSLRPDHLSCYGYHRRTSPNIDRVASEGVRFTNCYASDIPCAPSRTALMTGQFGIHNGLICHHGSAADVHQEGNSRGFESRLSKESLPGLLRLAGHHTASISPFPDRHGQWAFNAGFLETMNTGLGGMESAEHITPTVVDWLERNADREDWFLHVNYWDPHMPSRVPEDVANPFVDEPLSDFYTEEEVARQVGLVGAQMPHMKERAYRRYREGKLGARAGARAKPYPQCVEQIRTLQDVKQIVDAYDASIRYLDNHLGQIFDHLRTLGIYDDVTIVISADHGENLGELGIYGDHKTADEATTHIPLIVKHPGGQSGHVDNGLHYHIDLAPTLAELAAADRPHEWDGKSYAPAIAGAESCGWEHLVLSAGWGTCQRSVRSGDWLYTRTYHDGYNCFPDQQLYHVVRDPHQVENLCDSSSQIVNELDRILEEWKHEMVSRMPYPGTRDPMDVVLEEGGPLRGNSLGTLIDNLLASGRDHDAQMMRDRYESEIREP